MRVGFVAKKTRGAPVSVATGLFVGVCCAQAMPLAVRPPTIAAGKTAHATFRRNLCIRIPPDSPSDL
jgi:hypothetical protein